MRAEVVIHQIKRDHALGLKIVLDVLRAQLRLGCLELSRIFTRKLRLRHRLRDAFDVREQKPPHIPDEHGHASQNRVTRPALRALQAA